MARENTEVEPVPDDLPGVQKYLARFRADFDAHNHDGANSKRFLTLLAETLSGRALTIRKRSFTDNTSGLWAGLVGNTMKLFIGTASAYLKWTGTALQIAGDIVAGSLTIGSNSTIDSSGNATFISMTSLNMRSYTSFEASGRFITTGDVAPTFGNQGMTVAPGATATHYARALWWITNYVYNNNPFFTCSLLILSKGAGDARGFVGLGAPTIDGSSLATTGVNYAGFRFIKSSGALSIEASQCDGSGSRDSASISGLSSLADGDSVELFMKMTSTNIKYYYRLNGGTLTLGATLSNNKPSGSETYIGFMVTNSGTANDCQIQMQSAAYEH